MQVGRKVVFVIAANAAGAVLGYGALLMIGRYFAPAAFGSFVFASGIAGLFALATTLGLGTAHQRLVARGQPEAVVIGTAARLRLALVAAGILLVVGVAWVMARLSRPILTDATTPLVLAGALALHIIAMARQFFGETWGGRQHVTRVEAGKLLDAFLLLVALANAGLMVASLTGRWSPLPQVGAWWADRLGLEGPLTTPQAALLLLGCYLAAKVVSFLVAAAWAARDGIAFGPYDAAVARQLWSFGLPLALTAAIGLVLQYTDVVLLGFFWTAYEVGLYGTAQKLSVLAGLAAVASSGVLLSRFAQLSALGDAAAEARTFQDSERWLLIVVVPVVAALVALAVPAIHIAVGDAYLPGADTLRVLALATLVGALQVPLGARLMGHGRTRILVQAGLLNAVANVALNLAFIPRFGLGLGAVGAAGATLISNLLAYAWLRRNGRREFAIPWIGTPAARVGLAASGVAIVWWQASVRWPSSMDRVWELAGWGLAGTIVYAALLVALRALEAKDLDLLRKAAHPRALWHELRGR
ncbi:MAG: oligosaccharide flippase family protein [Candidatus Thermoplasmatota archaeon]